MLTKELPIYAKCFELANTVTKISEELPRFYRYTLGQRMMDASLRLFRHVIRANRDVSARIAECEDIVAIIEEIGVMYRILERKKLMSLNLRAALMELIATIGRQANGWKKSVR